MHRFLNALTSGTPPTTLFHFTDRRNIDSIMANGLFSWRELNRRRLQVDAPGGNDWSHEADERLDLDRYVHLCLLEQHPMEHAAKGDGRIDDSVFLRVSPAVLQHDGILFCDEVSNKGGAVVRPLAEIDAFIDHEVTYTRTDWKDPTIQQRLQAARKFEILVPDHVPAALLRMP